jgi:hypothetical protein
MRKGEKKKVRRWEDEMLRREELEFGMRPSTSSGETK